MTTEQAIPIAEDRLEDAIKCEEAATLLRRHGHILYSDWLKIIRHRRACQERLDVLKAMQTLEKYGYETDGIQKKEESCPSSGI